MHRHCLLNYNTVKPLLIDHLLNDQTLFIGQVSKSLRSFAQILYLQLASNLYLSVSFKNPKEVFPPTILYLYKATNLYLAAKLMIPREWPLIRGFTVLLKWLPCLCLLSILGRLQTINSLELQELDCSYMK